MMTTAERPVTTIRHHDEESSFSSHSVHTISSVPAIDTPYVTHTPHTQHSQQSAHSIQSMPSVRSARSSHSIHSTHSNQSIQSNQSNQSLVILHKIASYLSLGDAENMTTLVRHSSDGNYGHRHRHERHGGLNHDRGMDEESDGTSAVSSKSGMSGALLPGYHSLDQNLYGSAAGGVSGVGSEDAGVSGFNGTGSAIKLSPSRLSQYSQYSQHGHQSLSSIIDSNDENDAAEDEDWFVGEQREQRDQQQIQPLMQQNSSSPSSCKITGTVDRLEHANNFGSEGFDEANRLGGASTPNTPGLVALSPLEEEWDNDPSRIWTPAGQPTCERCDEGKLTPYNQVNQSSQNSQTNQNNQNQLCIQNCDQSQLSNISNMSQMSQLSNQSQSHNSSPSKQSNLNEQGSQTSQNSQNNQRSDQSNSSYKLQKQHRQQKQQLQHKLAAAVFAHPFPLRDYCLDAYATALSLSKKRQMIEQQKQQQQQQQQQSQRQIQGQQQQNLQQEEHPPETLRDQPQSPSSDLHGPEVPPELGEHHLTNQKSGLIHQANHANQSSEPNQQIQPLNRKHYKKKLSHSQILKLLIKKILQSVPLSILIDLAEQTFDLSLDTLFASFQLSSRTFHSLFSTLCTLTTYALETTLDILTRVNPLQLLELVYNVQKQAESAVGKTGEVLVSGIQSVATGVHSASSAALNRLSRQGLALAGGVVVGVGDRVGGVGGSRGSGQGLSRGSRGGGLSSRGGHGSSRTRKDGVGENHLNSKLFRRLHKMDSVSKLIAYSERNDEALGKHAKKRAQRMMHYNVSFRPFTATIQPPSPRKNSRIKPSVSFELHSLPNTEGSFSSHNQSHHHNADDDSLSSETISTPGSGSMFMRTPTSFPPTPTSRMYYFERGSRFTENVVFLARDQLRVEGGLGSKNAQTRAMSRALADGSRLAVFDAGDTSAPNGSGIALSCGQHIATKVGNSLYCSTRSMIPVMRNSYVYFEISVSPPPSSNEYPNSNGQVFNPQYDVTTLSIGLSTLDMPLNTLVGAWKGSVGLCTTGQILQSGQWLSSVDPQECSYGSNSTVGCLVYLDDRSARDTWEGVLVAADVTFSINGMVVPSTFRTEHPPMSPPRDDEELMPTLSLTVPRVHELFPTVTLHSPATCVMCRFSAEDVLATKRSEIGAPKGVTVYAVDGSVILDDACDYMDEYEYSEEGELSEGFLDSSSCDEETPPHEEVAL